MVAEQGGTEEANDRPGGHAGSGVAGFAMGMVFGALLGAAFALLYAPDKGEKTRRQLKRRIQRLREEAAEGLDRAGERGRKELIRRRRRLEAGLDRAAERTREALE
jgi:YtxH-like protein